LAALESPLAHIIRDHRDYSGIVINLDAKLDPQPVGHLIAVDPNIQQTLITLWDSRLLEQGLHKSIDVPASIQDPICKHQQDQVLGPKIALRRAVFANPVPDPTIAHKRIWEMIQRGQEFVGVANGDQAVEENSIIPRKVSNTNVRDISISRIGRLYGFYIATADIQFIVVLIQSMSKYSVLWYSKEYLPSNAVKAYRKK
jgi:hypothetical protein